MCAVFIIEKTECSAHRKDCSQSPERLLTLTVQCALRLRNIHILQIPDFPPTHLVLFGISLRIPFAIFPLRFWKRPVFKAFFEVLSFFKAFFLLFFFSLKQEKPCGRLGSATRFLGLFCLFFSLFLYFHTAVVKDKETALYGGFAKWNSQKDAKRGCKEIRLLFKLANKILSLYTFV